MSSESPAVFLDRDGTLNREKGYLYRWADWEWLPGAIEALAALKEAGRKLVVITNQAGVARGLYGPADIEALHRRVNEDLAGRGLAIDAFYYCPHHPDFTGPCDCRKPRPGMFLKAARELSLDLSRSAMVGDKLSDVEAGRAAGLGLNILLRTGYGREMEALARPGQVIVDDLKAAVPLILEFQHDR